MNPRLLHAVALFHPVAVAIVVRAKASEPLAPPINSPRGGEYFAHPLWLWTSFATNVCITFSYILFTIGIFWLAGRLKQVPELRRNAWVLWTLVVFFLARCVTIVLATLKFWWPFSSTSVFLNAFCAAASIPAAIAFVWRSPELSRNVHRFFNLLASEKSHAEALRKSENFLERTNELTGAGGWEFDLQSGEIAWSNQLCRIHGVPLGYKPVMQEVIQAYKPEVRHVLIAAIALARTEGEGWDLELPLRSLDGRDIWVRSVGVSITENGKPVRLTGAIQNISAIVTSRNALKQATERIEIATDSGRIGIWDWDLVAGTLFCDTWMHRLYGKSPLDHGGDILWRDRLHPEDRPRITAALDAAVAGVRPYEEDFRVVWPDGSTRYLRATARVFHNADGRAVRMVGATWDVTESRSLTAQLAEQHELLNVTLQAIGDGVISTDAKRTVTWLNPAAERMTGWPTSQAVGQPINLVFKTLNGETRESAENPVANFIAQGKTVGIARDTLLVSRDGTEFGIENAVVPIRTNLGELSGNVLVFRDVTEQRSLAAETERNSKLTAQLKLKDEFLSHVSHELRSPLTSIYSFTSIMDDGLAGETTPDQKDYLHIILKNVTQLQAMIEDLLTVTQSREGKLTVEPRRLDVCDAITDAVNTVQSSARAKSIALSALDCDGLPAGLADPTRLRQTLIILMDNAVKFTPAGGTVTVTATVSAPGLLLVQVTDSGCGIPKDKRTLVFDNLYQLSGSSAPDSSLSGRTGLGLGLHIAKELVTRQGGNIWVTEAPVQGSTFNFTLPIFTEDSASIKEALPDGNPRRRKTDLQVQSLPPETQAA